MRKSMRNKTTVGLLKRILITSTNFYMYFQNLEIITIKLSLIKYEESRKVKNLHMK